MEDKEMKSFSRTAFFLVTGFSFFFFSKLLQYLDGTSIPAFTLGGVLFILIGSLRAVLSLKERPKER